MQPFDKQQDDVASLEGCGQTLVEGASDALANGTATRGAYAPAIDAVRGDCAPLVESAGDDVDSMSTSAQGSLAWAAVATRYWGSQVRSFNERVDEITGGLADQAPRYGAPTDPDATAEEDDDAVADARDAARAEARQQWWSAHETHVVGGRETAARMLDQGPTPANVSTAVDAGALPPMEPYQWEDFVTGLNGMVNPPTDQGTPGALLWTTAAAMRPGSWALSWMNNYSITRYTPGGGLTAGRHAVPFSQRGPMFRFTDAARSGAWRVTPGTTRVQRAQWARYGRWMGRAGTVVSGATGAWDQWTRDENRTDLSTGERVTRAGTRGALNAAGGAAGAWAGAKGGAMLGAAVGGPVGAAVGGIVGGVVGGVIGSGLAGKAADAIMESAPVEAIGEGLNTAGEAIGDAGEAVGDALSDAGDAIGDAAESLKFW